MSLPSAAKAYDKIGLIPSLHHTPAIISKARRDTVFHLQKRHGGKFITRHHHTGSLMEYTIAEVNNAADLIQKLNETGGLQYHLNREVYTSNWNPHAEASDAWYLPIPHWESLWQDVIAELNGESQQNPRDTMFLYKFKYIETYNARNLEMKDFKDELALAHKEVDNLIEKDQWWAAQMKEQANQIEDQRRWWEARWMEKCHENHLDHKKMVKQYSAIKTHKKTIEHHNATNLHWTVTWELREQKMAEQTREIVSLNLQIQNLRDHMEKYKLEEVRGQRGWRREDECAVVVEDRVRTHVEEDWMSDDFEF